MATPNDQEELIEPSFAAAEVDIPDDDDDDDDIDDGPERAEVRQPGEPPRKSRKERRAERNNVRLSREVERTVQAQLERMRPQQAQPVYAPQPQQRQEPAADELSELQDDLQFTLSRLSDPNVNDADHKKLLARYHKLEEKKTGIMIRRATPRTQSAPQSSPHVEQLRYEYRDVLKGNIAAEDRAATMAKQKFAADPSLGLYGAIRESLEEMRVATKAASARPAVGSSSRYGNSSSGGGSTVGGGRTTMKLTKSQVSQARSVYPSLNEEKAIAKWATEMHRLEKSGKV